MRVLATLLSGRLHVLAIGLAALGITLIGGPGTGAAIVGGRPASTAERPYVVSLYSASEGVRDGSFCAGALVAPDRVLTARHCVWDPETGLLRLPVTMLRAHLRDDYLAGIGEDAGVVRADAPPVVVRPELPDIALLTLDRNVSSPPIPVSGDTRWISRPGGTVWAAGWGILQESDPWMSDGLREVALHIFTPGTCRTLVGRVGYGGFDLCAGEPGAGGYDTCQGDSGGPLAGVGADGRQYLVGITSRGAGCGRALFPGLYTDLDHPSLATWLEQQGIPVARDTGSAATERIRPVLRVFPGSPRVGRPMRAWYRVREDSGRTSEEVVLLRRGQPLDYVSTRFDRSRPGTRYSVTLMKRIPRSFHRRTFVVCITSVDGSGNASPRRCAPLRVR